MKQFLSRAFNTFIFIGLYKYYEFFLPDDTFGKAVFTTIMMSFIPILFSYLLSYITPSKNILNTVPYYEKFITKIFISQVIQFFSIFVIYYSAFKSGYMVNKYIGILKTICYQTLIWEMHNLIFYITHRMSHESNFLYTNVHTDHHIGNNTPNNLLLASDVSILETLINIPFHIFINIFLFPTDLFNHFIIINLLSIVFYVGHTGMYVKVCAHSTLFQFINHYFFPVSTCLFTQEHYDHHRYYTCNYGFSSSLVDRVLGTYREFKK